MEIQEALEIIEGFEWIPISTVTQPIAVITDDPQSVRAWLKWARAELDAANRQHSDLMDDESADEDEILELRSDQESLRRYLEALQTVWHAYATRDQDMLAAWNTGAPIVAGE